MKDVLEGYNDWKIIHIRETQTADPDEIEDLYEDILDEHEAMSANDVNIGGFAAYDMERYYIIQWTSEAFALEEDSDDVEGVDGTLPAGSIVARGIFWIKVAGAAGWWHAAPVNQRVEKLFRIRYVVSTNVIMEEPSESVKFPNMTARIKRQVLALHPRRLKRSSHEDIKAEQARRALIAYEEGLGAVEDGDVVNLQDDSDSSDSSDSDSSDDEDE